MNRNWIFVCIAGLFEIVWVTGLKNASNLISWMGTFIAICISFDMLIRSTKRLPVGTVYAVFTGIGTVGTVGVEMIIFDEPFSWIKVLLILLLISGVLGLKMVTKEDSDEKGVAT
ncbi:multidrug resistance protein YkkC [Paenibacillus baekrokdamisoli]|uniref:Multidrug resistance protein YkkC n=1 Tax=Paenibacillus baekrokdamisoli TaxID=1712516 RepID=A0A3G9JNB3_9BACL|nr:multidrug efflux SMR transporter [Paenibacillus baekrokdamisoli]MBB3071440.1 paired small multidrug resistance pump [Paenibacillus baekrokdamisoli]BBH24529.1 multidrug resistance protein YkkC [Paenibacillus baekrokdamisoli]